MWDDRDEEIEVEKDRHVCSNVSTNMAECRPHHIIWDDRDEAIEVEKDRHVCSNLSNNMAECRPHHIMWDDDDEEINLSSSCLLVMLHISHLK